MDRVIIQRFINGDAEAFDLIYRTYSKKIYHFALGLIKSNDQTTELVQQVFVNLWEKRENVNPDLSFDNYLFTICYNAIRKYFRQKKIETKVSDHLVRNAPEIIESVDSLVIYRELLDIANRSIEKLPPQRKTIYKLSKQEGMKIKEIASKLNISTRTAENQLARALKFLKEELSKTSLLTCLFFHLFMS